MAYPNTSNPLLNFSDISGILGSDLNPGTAVGALMNQNTPVSKEGIMNTLGMQISLIQNFVNKEYLGRSDYAVNKGYINNIYFETAVGTGPINLHVGVEDDDPANAGVIYHSHMDLSSDNLNFKTSTTYPGGGQAGDDLTIDGSGVFVNGYPGTSYSHLTNNKLILKGSNSKLTIDGGKVDAEWGLIIDAGTPGATNGTQNSKLTLQGAGGVLVTAPNITMTATSGAATCNNFEADVLYPKKVKCGRGGGFLPLSYTEEIVTYITESAPASGTYITIDNNQFTNDLLNAVKLGNTLTVDGCVTGILGPFIESKKAEYFFTAVEQGGEVSVVIQVKMPSFSGGYIPQSVKINMSIKYLR